MFFLSLVLNILYGSGDTNDAASAVVQSKVPIQFIQEQLDLSHAGDLKGLYRTSLLMLRSKKVVSSLVWTNVFGIVDSAKHIAPHISWVDTQNIASIDSWDPDETKDSASQRLYILPNGLDKKEDRVKNLFLSIQEAARSGLSEAAQFLESLNQTPHYLESKLFFNRLHILLSVNLNDPESLVLALEDLEKCNLENEEIRDVIGIYLKKSGKIKFYERSKMIEEIKKDRLNQSFNGKAYSFVTFCSLLPIIYFMYCSFWLVDCLSNVDSLTNSTFFDTIAGRATACPTSWVTAPGAFFAGFFGSIPALYNAYRTYHQKSCNEYEVARFAELLSAKLVVLNQDYKLHESLRK